MLSFIFSMHEMKKKRKKNPREKIVKIAFSLTNFAENFNFWLVKISGHGFSSFFAKFLPFFKVECARACQKHYRTLKNHQKWQNFGKK